MKKKYTDIFKLESSGKCEKCGKKTKTEPTGYRYWIKEHQITSFWHKFGISNDLIVPIIDVKKEGKFYRINKHFMVEQLEDFISKLEDYGRDWNSTQDHPFGVDTREKFIKDQGHDSRDNILKMIELLQEFRIKDK